MSLLLVCADTTCGRARRIPVQFDLLGSSKLRRPLPSEICFMAVNPDGRVLLTRPKYIPGEVYIIRL
ncbi:hypothetical protein Cme02nite_27630 [Catellatospora methionotrophica]|uniref:Uncharacterized protein n=1 Tax=Catellatospora methionotrophica TaxID=121620 RepID=A0A8J3PEC1_9ACTN|nr:hypothetical protein [Catellatospora methionotrophica]GIG14431.1 hypothetical protein Cme02nite_27630 [Catellatospora methionotrophica]